MYDLKKGFTLAEVLITLGIIGVVAALTIPTLISKYKKQVVASKLEQTYSILNNAALRAIEDYDDPIYWDYTTTGTYSNQFIAKYFVPYLKASVCSYPSNIQSVYTQSGNLAFHVVWTKQNNMYCLSNGVSILGVQHGSNGRTAGQRIIVDINGPKAPNVYGKDIFELYMADENMRKDPYYKSRCGKGLIFCLNGTWSNQEPTRDQLKETCLNAGGNSGINTCGYLIHEDGWKIPDDYPIDF